MAKISLSQKDRLITMRDRFKLADASQSEQAKREDRAIRFENGEQSTPAIQAARAGMAASGNFPAVPERPWIVVNKLIEPGRQIMAQERDAELGIELVPADDFGDLGITPDDTEITLREGLTRRIQREPDAAQARSWAFSRATKAGRGFYMVLTRYLPGRTFDQEVYVHRIYNQAGVLLDPSHESPDGGSDSDWGFVGGWMPLDRFESTHPKDMHGDDNPFFGISEDDFVSMSESYPEWYQTGDTKSQRAVRIVDYWHTERVHRSIVQMEDGTILWNESAPDDAAPQEAVEYLPEGVKPFPKSANNVREMIEKQIKFWKVAGGTMELEQTDWPGDCIPIIKVVGEEILPYDNQRRYRGYVEPAIDSCMGENYMISKLVETTGQQPIPLLQVDPEAIDGFEDWYKLINTRTLPYAPYRSYDDQGRPLQPPHRLAVDPNTQHLAGAVAMFDSFIKSTTSVPDSTLGNVDPSLKSGRAIREVVANAAQSTSNYMDNLARSMRYEGHVINGLLYPIYGSKPGRLVRTLNGEGEASTMRIGSGSQSDPAQAQQAEKVAKLTKDAHFNVIVKIGKSYDSRRQQEASQIGELMSANPELITWFGDLFFKNADGPGHMAMSDRAKVMLAPPIQAMLAAKDQGRTIDPQTEAKIAQLTEQLQHAEAAMQELDKIANGKKLEQETKLQVETVQSQRDIELEKLKNEAAIMLQGMKDATAIRVAEINAETKGVLTDHTIAHERQALHDTQAHEAGMAEAQASREREMVEAGMANDAASTAVQMDYDAESSNADRQFQAEQSAQAAEQEPTE